MENIAKKAREAAGWRELYAMKHGHRASVYVGGHLCIKYTYNKSNPYQDGNGATFDTVRGVWVN